MHEVVLAHQYPGTTRLVASIRYRAVVVAVVVLQPLQ